MPKPIRKRSLSRHTKAADNARTSRQQDSEPEHQVRLTRQRTRAQSLQATSPQTTGQRTRGRSVPTTTRQRTNQQNAITKAAAASDTTHFQEAHVPQALKLHNCGTFQAQPCAHCNAYIWPNELHSICYQNGKVVLQPLPAPPEEIEQLFSKPQFLSQIRGYNNALALASTGSNEVQIPGFNPTFKIQGKIHHRIGSLLPQDSAAPKFAQIYFYDTDNELQNRLQHVRNLDPNILTSLQQCLHECNSYIASFKAAIELTNASDNDIRIILHADKNLKPSTEHCRRYNLPTNSEVSALIPGEPTQNRDIIIHCRDGRLQRIRTLHRSYDALHYVIFFPYGTDSWHLGMKKTDNRTLTALDFYSFHLQVRKNDCNIIMKGRRLMQQFAVDQWAKIEQSRLQWVTKNQRTIRAEKYQGLFDAVRQGDTVNPGRKIILPPTIYGSPQFYSEAFQNAMAIVRQLGKPDYFITFTTNPK
jgi:hypothetical protein